MPIRTLFRCVSKIALVLTIALVLALSEVCVYAAEPVGLDLHGRPVRQLAGPGVRVVVLLFAASDCPVSNRYVPEIARLHRELSGRGVLFWWVYPNPGDTAAVVARHNRDFSIHENTLLDTRQTLVAWAQVTSTPEAAVFVVEGSGLSEVYHGRIDDRYISLGQERPQPEHHDLETAIYAAMEGKSVPKPEGLPVGCSIVFLQK
jgi:hypothetical protein